MLLNTKILWEWEPTIFLLDPCKWLRYFLTIIHAPAAAFKYHSALLILYIFLKCTYTEKIFFAKINRGYYTVARRYEFYVRVARTISHERAQRTSGILFLPREHKVHIFEPTCNFLFLYKHTDDGIFLWFSKDFRLLSEDFRRFSKIVPKARQTFQDIFRKFPKISEDVRRLPKTFEEDPKMFRWYSNEFKYNLRDKLDISEIIDIFTCEDIVSFLSICYHSVYHWLLYNKTS